MWGYGHGWILTRLYTGVGNDYRPNAADIDLTGKYLCI